MSWLKQLSVSCLLALSLILSGCAGKQLFDDVKDGTPSQQFYATLALYDAVDEQAAVLVQAENTPNEVKRVVIQARKAAVAALELAQVAHDVWQEADAAFKALPPETTEADLNAALARVTTLGAAFVAHKDRALSKVDAFKDLIQSYTSSEADYGNAVVAFA